MKALDENSPRSIQLPPSLLLIALGPRLMLLGDRHQRGYPPTSRSDLKASVGFKRTSTTDVGIVDGASAAPALPAVAGTTVATRFAQYSWYSAMVRNTPTNRRRHSAVAAQPWSEGRRLMACWLLLTDDRLWRKCRI